MEKHNYYSKIFFIFLLLSPIGMLAQTVKGKLTDSKKEPVPFATVIEKGTSNGTTTDSNGNFELNVSKIPTTIQIQSIGYITKSIIVNSSKKTLLVSIKEESVGLNEVVVTGNRAKPRTILNSTVPIDNISAKDLASSGQVEVSKMLTYKVPSYNASTQAISDATAHFDPADLRGLGPSRTLVLINGKRKNQSALVYINDTPGKGEVGVDMGSIPVAAIDHIEVLRDGASAQYGSDAIAGVINIVLKKGATPSSFHASSGITTKGDGFNADADINYSFNFKNGAFINATLGASNQLETNRAGSPGEDRLFGVGPNNPYIQKHPDLGTRFGQPQMLKLESFYNSEFPFKNNKGKIYSFGGLTYRKGKSYALYRTPYWPGVGNDPYFLLHDQGELYEGFQPTFNTNIFDNTNVIGVLFDISKFKVDLSGTYGRNSVDYNIGNTLNTSLGSKSPTEFDAGGYRFSNLIANLDLSRSFGDISIAFGAELKDEKFIAIAGEPDSYFGSGAQSFPGLQPTNAVNVSRTSEGVYLNVDWDATKDLLFSGAVRYENFSDFGDNTSGKISARYKLGKIGALRGSYSSGFRAPSLHQIYLSNIQTLLSGGTISNQGTFNNVSPVIRDGLGVPKLEAELSNNVSAGLTLRPIRNLSLAIDFYNVKVKNRVLFSNEIGFDSDDLTINPVEKILNDYKVTSIKFFVNAVNTETNGVDFVASYDNVEMGNGKLGFSLVGNYNKTKISGKIKTPKVLADNGYDIFNRKEQARITSARPRTKVILGINYKVKNFSTYLNNTYFGEVTWQSPDPAKDQTFSGKVVTDLIFNYDFSNKLSANLTANNLFNVYPDLVDPKGDPTTNLGGRFIYPWEVNQFGFSGTILKIGLTYKL